MTVNTQQIETICSSGVKLCLVVAGGGSGTIYALLSRPGASRCVLDVRIPYSHSAMEDYLGLKPTRSCSDETAMLMARRAFERAGSLAPGEQVVGISCTAALQTLEKRDDADRAYICFLSSADEVVHELLLQEGERGDQEKTLSSFLIEKLAAFLSK